MKIAMSPTRQAYPLSRRKIAKKTLTRTIILSFLCLPAEAILIVLAFALKGKADQGVPSAVFVYAAVAFFCFYWLLVLLIYLYQRWYFATYFYDLQEHQVIIEKNPITPHEITLPLARVQDVYVDQDLWDRFFRLYDVHLSTATVSSAMEAHIDGLMHDSSDGLRNELLQSIHAKLNSAQNNNQIGEQNGTSSPNS